MKLIVDSSILIDYLRGGKKWEKIIQELEKDTRIYIPTVVIFELFSGESSRISRRSKDMTDLIEYFQRIELTEGIAKRAGELYRDVTKDLEVPDYIIAASAIEIGGTVLTLNKKHFEQIPYLKLYLL